MTKKAIHEINHDIDRITKIIGTGIFEKQQVGNELVLSAITEVLICLNDLLMKTKMFTERVSFKDDLNIGHRVTDITEAVKWCRDAACHVHIPQHQLDPKQTIIFSYNIAYGKVKILSIGSTSVQSDYPDDVCFFFGGQKLYLNRHILRAFDEALIKLRPII